MVEFRVKRGGVAAVLVVVVCGVSGCGRTASFAEFVEEDGGAIWPDAGLLADAGLVADGPSPLDGGLPWPDGSSLADQGWWLDAGPSDAAGWPDAQPVDGGAADARPVDGAVDAGADAAPPPLLPDLLIEGLGVTTESFGVTYTFSVCNAGNRASSYTYADLYIDAPAVPDDRSGDGGFFIPPLRVGACRSLTYRRTLAPGRYRSWVQVDRRQLVDEINEQNNIAGPLEVVVGPMVQPDLTIRWFVADVRDAERVVYTIAACNVGQSLSDATTVELFFDRDDPPTARDSGDRSLYIGPLEPGRCGQVSYNASFSPGTYLSWAYVDGGDRIDEQDERNNVAGPQRIVLDPTQRADLLISEFSARQESQGRVRYSINVCNFGYQEAPPSYVALYYDRVLPPTATTRSDQIGYVPRLQPRQCRRVDLFGTLAPGTYSSWAYADYLDRVEEANEQNNAAGPSRVVVVAAQQADLLISRFVARDTDTGDVDYAVTVCNRGALPSQTTAVGIFYDRSGSPGPASTPDATFDFPSLPVRRCATRVFSTQLEAGSYSSWAVVDPFNQLAEGDEDNNIAGPEDFTIAHGDRCETICGVLYSPCGMVTPENVDRCRFLCDQQPEASIDCAYQAALRDRCIEIAFCFVGP